MAQTFKLISYSRKQGSELVVPARNGEREVFTKDGTSYKEVAALENGKVIWVRG